MDYVKFTMEIYNRGTEDRTSIVNGSATESQIDRMLAYLLKIKEEDFINERAD
jgi:Holliday junction resolvasome RuvABC endonuclease subunit